MGFGRCPVRVGVGHGQGAVRWPATRAGFGPARNLNEWPPGLARRGPRAEQVGKAHGADRPHPRATHQPTPCGCLAVGLALVVRVRPASSCFHSSAALSLRGLVAGRPAVAEPRAGRVGGRTARDPRQRVALKTYRKFGRILLRLYAVAVGWAFGWAAGLVRWPAGCGSCYICRRALLGSGDLGVVGEHASEHVVACASGVKLPLDRGHLETGI